MFINETLKTHLETSATIQLRSLVLAEWNMNMPDNIFLLGNYRYRPTTPASQFHILPVIFDSLDSGGYYTGATDADVVVDGGFENNGTPQQFTLPKTKMKMLYSLEDCIKPFRPRSGINKPLYFPGSYMPNSGADMAQRPRWYMPSRYDQFRYWTSYRTEDNFEYGIAKNISNGLYYIDDAVPFVVYKNNVPANRLVVKVQTGVGSVDLGPFATATSSIDDPLYGEQNKKTPARWRIQYLRNNDWIDAYVFTENDTRADGSPIIAPDGYVELQYGLIVPESYKNIFRFAETLSSNTLLPEVSLLGYAYLVVENEGDIGTFYIWDGDSYEQFTPEYGWLLGSETITNTTSFVTDLTSPSSFNDTIIGGTSYREFEYVRGIRVVVDTMNKFDSTLDLIEFSPRLVVDLSDKTIQYDVTKILSDVGVTSLPVGQLLASTGSMSLFDDDQAFNENNSTSIIADYVRKNIKFLFYEVISNVRDVDESLYDYYVPIKTMYSEGFPQADVTAGTISIELRDFYFFLESMPAPRLMMTETSLSMAVVTLLDFVGFTNYTFKRIENESDPVIPYFFVAPDQNVAEVLNQLAIATQTAMFFDEYNNFVVMSKNYLMPTETERPIDFVLLGNNNQLDNGVVENLSSGNLPNIISIASQDKKVYNDGKISYTTRYLQRTYGSIRQASMVDKDKTWIYKPALLWEVAGTPNTKTINEVASQQGNYVLGAMPINSDLPSTPPTVSGGVVINNTIDLGENVYWLTRYQGYFYSNGEIIRYDAAEFNITGTGNVWITSNQEYQKYFSTLPFNGKIYPTGLVRIYSIPYFETIDGIERLQPGAVYEHGRGQFGTPIVAHTAGISSYWSDNAYVRGCDMQAQYLFTTQINPTIPSTTTGAAGVNNDLAKQTTRNGIIKNFMATNYLTDSAVNNLKSTQSGTIQSSALVMNGPSFRTTETPLNFISYVYKQLDNAYKLFGTRMRIIGKIENNETRTQTPIGSTSYYQVTGALPNQNLSIGGGSGGIAVLLNPETNNGYYFEIIAMTEDNIQSYITTNNAGQPNISINNVVFYKVKKDSTNNDAIPVKLWGGLSSIIVDDGRFTGQYRMAGEENTTVYDLSVEYEDIGTIRRFYLYINNKLIQIVDDADPMPIYNNSALFVRGSSRVMFENIYALAENYSQNTVFTVGETLSSAFGDTNIDANESFRKYAMSGIIQATYLDGISSEQPPRYNMYFDEFGTIMRECAYFDIKYDRSYPALYAQLSPTLNRIKGYAVSGFQADSYGAEFLIFNATDTALNLDETTGNYLRIQGITFTQDTTYELTVDEYFKKRSNFSIPQLQGSAIVTSPLVEKAKYDEIKQSRIIYGKNEFAIESPYIQSQDDAEQLMGWIINKVMVPKKAVGVNMFAIPTLQLGDIVTITYQDNSGLNLVTPTITRFVIYNIRYGRDTDGPSMTLYLSEV
jgi:hypothetical protein